MRENTNTLSLFLSGILQDKKLLQTLKYFGYKTVKDVPLPLKEMKKEVGIELLLKEHIKIKDPYHNACGGYDDDM